MKIKSLAGLWIAFLLASSLSAGAAQKTTSTRPRTGPSVPSTFRLAGWAQSGKTLTFSKARLFDHIGGRAEIFLQYGFTDLTVHRFTSTTGKKPGKVITLEIFRMTTPSDAFGIFSIRHDGTQKASTLILALNWVGSAQAAFVKGNVFVHILAPGCQEAAIEEFAAAIARRINLPPNSGPVQIARLPKENLIPGSERYIKGNLAAAAESPFLERAFWGFKGGVTRAFSGRYNPNGSKLIVINLAQPLRELPEMVTSLFKEYLEVVRTEAGYILGENSAGSYFVFAQEKRTAALVLGETDAEAAKARLDEALKNE